MFSHEDIFWECLYYECMQCVDHKNSTVGWAIAYLRQMSVIVTILEYFITTDFHSMQSSYIYKMKLL